MTIQNRTNDRTEQPRPASRKRTRRFAMVDLTNDPLVDRAIDQLASLFPGKNRKKNRSAAIRAAVLAAASSGAAASIRAASKKVA